MGGARFSRRGPARAASGAAAAEVSVRAAAPSRVGDGPEPGYARADNRAPGWPADSRGWKEGADAGLRTPPARPRGARGACASRQRSRRSAFRRRPSARPVQSPVFSPLPSPARPPARAACSALFAAFSAESVCLIRERQRLLSRLVRWREVSLPVPRFQSVRVLCPWSPVHRTLWALALSARLPLCVFALELAVR